MKKKTDRPVIAININGDNNRVTIGAGKSSTAATIIAVSVVLGAAVLAVSHCCPEQFTDFVRWMISIVISN